MTLAAGAKLGPYEVLAPIGAGGMGEVYRARDERLDREVAIKVLPASFSSDADRLRRFEQEARSAGKLNHPNVLAIYDVGMHDGAPYVVSELLEGATLRERIAGGAVPVRKAVDYALQLARGLGAAHEKGIVHRDLKPENVFLTSDGRVKILDFGLAKLTRPDAPADASAAPTETRGTEPGVVLGTVGYMAPEQVRGLAADARADIFAFGAILYETLAGRRAFPGPSSADVMSAILKEEPPPLADTGRAVPAPLDRLVSHCLEKNPEERFQSARDIAYELESLSGLSPSTRIPAVGGRARRRVSLPFALVAVAAAAAAGILAGRIGARPASGVPVFHPLTFNRGSIDSARFAPDGQSVVYSARWEGGPARLYVKRTDAGDSLALEVPGSEILAIGADGDMLIALDCRFTHQGVCAGTLARAPLTGGAPRAIEENVQQLDVARGGAIALVRDTPTGAQLEYPASGKALYKTTGHLSYPRISPKGDRVAFLDHPAKLDDGGSVAVVDLAGKKTTLAGPFGTAQGLAWSPDGTEVWFTAGENLYRRLYGVSLSGRRRELASSAGSLTLYDVSPAGRALVGYQTDRVSTYVSRRGEARDRDVSWLNWTLVTDISADGKTLLIEEEGGDRPGYMAALRRSDASNASLVRLGAGSPIALSPDEKWVLVHSGGAESLVPTGAGKPEPLPKSGLHLSPAASWFPDGRHILISGTEPGHAERLYVRDLQSGAVRPISPEGVFLFGMSEVVSPDGRLALGVRTTDGATLILPTDGTEAPRVVAAVDAKRERPIRWTEDGRGLFVREVDAFPFEIFRIDLASGEKTSWMRIAPADLAGAWLTPLVRLSADGTVCAYSMQRRLSELYLLDGLRR